MPGDRADVGAADVTHAFFVPRLKYRAAEMAGDAALFQRQQQGAVGGVAAHVHQRSHFNALIVQVQRGQITVIVARQHHSALARLDCVELHQALRGTGQHHAGQIVVTENHRLVERATGDQALRGAHFVHAHALNHRQVVVSEPGVAGGFFQHANVGVAFDGADQFSAHGLGASAFEIEAGVSQRAAEDRLLLDQQHFGASVGGSQCGLKTGRACADHGQISEQIGFVVILGLEFQIEHTQAGLLANDRLPEFPRALGLV